MKTQSSVRWLERSLWIAGIVLLGWVGWVWADGRIYQSQAEQRLEQALASRGATRTQLLPGDDSAAGFADSLDSEATADAEPGLPDDLVGRLEIPRLGLSVMVSEGTSAAVLRRGAGHLTATALPGGHGNVAVAAHRDRHFRPLKDVAPGDEVLLTTLDGTFRYRVSWTEVVDPDALQVLESTDEPVLTLLTCYPFYFVGNAPHRFVVRARQVGWQPPA
jgi:sortase A